MEKIMDISRRNNSVHVLVTGGARFIGSNLCEELLNQGYRVTCLDNFSTGNIKNIIHLTENEKFTLLVGDIRDYDTCVKVTADVDYILHQAALGSVSHSTKDMKSYNSETEK